MTETFETDTAGINAADVVRRCGWKTCAKGFQGGMSTGWIYWTPTRAIAEIGADRFGKRGAVLCPKHAAELEALTET
jgi:hypothetical protein